MVNKRDKSIQKEAVIIMFIKEKVASVQSNSELYKEITNYL
jgi:hypothetical protein